MSKTTENTETIIENGYAEMCRGFYRLRKAGKYQEEYDSMGVILTMLTKDRQLMRERFKIEF